MESGTSYCASVSTSCDCIAASISSTDSAVRSAGISSARRERGAAPPAEAEERAGFGERAFCLERQVCESSSYSAKICRGPHCAAALSSPPPSFAASASDASPCAPSSAPALAFALGAAIGAAASARASSSPRASEVPLRAGSVPAAAASPAASLSGEATGGTSTLIAQRSCALIIPCRLPASTPAAPRCHCHATSVTAMAAAMIGPRFRITLADRSAAPLTAGMSAALAAAAPALAAFAAVV
mmetsp:Transcript_23948/g.60560  ORF Transcript_23948/g.60560 Transcript_23948/m.60560 type:complete len:243 (-) Transcript_23948:597-1325(-)